MDFKTYIQIEICIQQRIEDLCVKHQLPRHEVERQYITRLNQYQRKLPQEYTANQSKFMTKAYQETQKYYEEKTR